MNRRGDFPTILLFFFTLLLIGISMFSFVSFAGDFNTGSQNIGKVVSDLVAANDFISAEVSYIGMKAIEKGGDLKSNFMEIAGKRPFRVEGGGNLFVVISSGEFDFGIEEGEIVLEIQGVFVESSSGESSIRRDFDLRVIFDEDGSVLKSQNIYK